MAKLHLKNITKVYEDGQKAIDDITMAIADKEFIVLVGPSGCGKSTVLRMIAGLESISAGEICIDGELVNHLSPKERNIAMVFQSYALYPHMNVRDNIAFSLKMSGISKAERYRLVAEVAETLQLTAVLDKKPGALSGGQRQRVALGRSMVRKPKVFLLDEPLSNLDAKLRVSMRAEIVQLHRHLGTTFVYVTHDQTEAMTMGTRIAVLNAGQLEQFDTPANLYQNPVNKFVAEFIGSPQMNMLKGRLVTAAGRPLLVLNEETTLPLPAAIEKRLLVAAAGQSVYVGVRPEHLQPAASRDGGDVIAVTANNVEQVGSDTYVYFDFPAAERECTARFHPARPVPLHADILIRIDVDQILLFNQETGAALLAPKPVSGLSN